METKEIILLIVALLGWSWGIVQFLINRRNQKKDKLIDRKYEAYSAYMKKSDEVMSNVRTDPSMIYGVTTEFMNVAVTGDAELINNALVQFNEKIIGLVKKASEPLMILKQELSSLLLICSYDLAVRIEELILLTKDFNTEMQKTFSLLSPNDSNYMISQLQTLVHNERWLRFESLNKEIVQLMRKEIGN